MPSKKFKRIRREDVPQAFDLSAVSQTEVTYLPGGLDRALEGSTRNRHHAFKGMAWHLGGGLSVKPGDWLLLPLRGIEDWWLVYLSEPLRMLIVSTGGGYLEITKKTFLFQTLDVRYNAPWEGDQTDEPRSS